MTATRPDPRYCPACQLSPAPADGGVCLSCRPFAAKAPPARADRAPLALVQPSAFDPVGVAETQGAAAFAALDARPESFLHFPLRGVDALVGGMAAGVWFVAAFSGQGKSTFVMSLLKYWFDRGKRIYVLGLETRPLELRTHWACRDVGVDPGHALDGGLIAAELAGDGQAAAQRLALKRHIKWQTEPEQARRVYFSPVPAINQQLVWAACQESQEFGADVTIVDHIDHTESETGDLYPESVATVKTTLRAAHEFDRRIIATTQLNNEAVKRDRLAQFQSPQPHHVYMGAHKRMVAEGMLGLHKPLIGPQGTGPEAAKRWREAKEAVRHDEAKPHTILEPNTMCVSVMKHRKHGSREGLDCRLSVRDGLVCDRDLIEALADQARAHRITTNRDAR